MKTFFDSSAFAKRFIAEPGSDAADELCEEADRLALCVLCVPEIVSALNRRVREKVLGRTDYATIKARLLDDLRDAEIVNLTDDVIAHSLLILERNAIRAMDALQVSCADAWGADLFVSADKGQVRAARHTGLACRLI